MLQEGCKASRCNVWGVCSWHNHQRVIACDGQSWTLINKFHRLDMDMQWIWHGSQSIRFRFSSQDTFSGSNLLEGRLMAQCHCVLTFLDTTSKPDYQILSDGTCLALHRQLLPHCGPSELQFEAQNPRLSDKLGLGRFSLCLRIIVSSSYHYAKPLQSTSLGSNKVAEVQRLSSAAEQEDSCSRISAWLQAEVDAGDTW